MRFNFRVEGLGSKVLGLREPLQSATGARLVHPLSVTSAGGTRMAAAKSRSTGTATCAGRSTAETAAGTITATPSE